MKRDEDIFLRLLRSALWDTEPGDLAGVDWNAILKIAEMQSVVPLIADTVLKNCCQGLTTIQLNFLQNRIFYNINSSNKLKTVLFKVSDTLIAAGIHPILLKGEGIATFYREPFLRQCGDIDLYIGKKDYGRAVDLILKMSDKDSSKEDSESIKHYHLHVDEIPVELHRISACMPNHKHDGIYSNFEEKYLDNSTDFVKIMDRDIRIPELTFNLLFVFYHAWYHFMSGGLGLRQICDITMYLDRNFHRIDKERFRNMLESLDLLQVWQVFMNISVNCLGLDMSKALFYEKCEQKRADNLLEFIFAEGNFGHYRDDVKHNGNINWIVRKVHTVSITTKRYIRLRKLFSKYIVTFYFNFLKSGFKALFHKKSKNNVG